jgi:hypothetical protein
MSAHIFLDLFISGFNYVTLSVVSDVPVDSDASVVTSSISSDLLIGVSVRLCM